MHSHSDGQTNLKIFDLNFNDLYQNAHIQLSLADLISKNEKDKPIIAAHLYGCNNISILSSKLLSEEEKREVNEKLKNNEEEVKERCKALSKTAIEEEFDAIFALVETRKRPVLYIRWMPKSDELFMASRDNHKGRFVCLYFFQDPNLNKNILIANPNGKAISDEYEAEVINSYLDKNRKVTIYQSKDYFQFGNTDCGPGALIFLRMLYNMSEKDLSDVLKEGQSKKKDEQNPFDYSSVEFSGFLQKEIGKIPQNKEEEQCIGQKLRYADYATAKACKENSDAIENSNCVALALASIPFDQKLVDGLAEDQVQLLSNILLSGKELLMLEQVLQVEQERRRLLKNSSKTIKSHCTSSSDGSIKTMDTSIIRNNKEKNSSLKSKITLAVMCTFSILGIILFTSLLSINYIKKEVSAIGLILSCAILTVAIAFTFFTINNVESKISDTNVQTKAKLTML